MLGKTMILDIGHIASIPYLASKRAAAFLGLGVNVARDPSFKRYQLDNIALFRSIPDDFPDQKIEEIKNCFEEWVITSVLRDLVEAYAVFLDHVHRGCLLMGTSKGRISQQQAESWGPAFERKGLDQKLSLLRERFNISTEREHYFTGIKQARNCLAHRRGIVGIEDVDEKDHILRLQWWRMEVFARTELGKEISLMPPIPEGGVMLEEGGDVCVRFSSNVREYKIGEVLRLSPNDISEIIFLSESASSEILNDLLNYAKSIGIEVRSEAK